MRYLNKERYDYILIWGHGLSYKEEILAKIREQSFIEILKVFYHEPKSIRKFVKTVYSYDYTPLVHLKSKTRYLLKTKKRVLFIFFRNKDPQEQYFGKGDFRHIECLRVKKLKEEIRNKFNPRKNGKRTENHVVHASDNELQTDYILKKLGYWKGVKMFDNTPNPFLEAPYYLSPFEQFSISMVKLDKLYGRILQKNGNGKLVKRNIRIKKTPHFTCLEGNISGYRDYLLKCQEKNYMQCDYSVENFLSLAKNFKYLKKPHTNSYILTRNFNRGNYIILDGLHRASILAHQNIKKAPVAIIL